MIDFEGMFQFASPPRTGTVWFLKACYQAGLGAKQPAGVHQPFAGGNGQTIRVSLVRHPADWLASWWQAIRGGSTGVTDVDRFTEFYDNDFPSFVRKYLRRDPGGVGRMFDLYRADTVMRLEDMPWALIDFLAQLNVPEPLRTRIHAITPQNQSQARVVWNRRLRERVLEAEMDVIERYDYF